jgi:hypothetical protein
MITVINFITLYVESSNTSFPFLSVAVIGSLAAKFNASDEFTSWSLAINLCTTSPTLASSLTCFRKIIIKNDKKIRGLINFKTNLV